MVTWADTARALLQLSVGLICGEGAGGAWFDTAERCQDVRTASSGDLLVAFYASCDDSAASRSLQRYRRPQREIRKFTSTWKSRVSSLDTAWALRGNPARLYWEEGLIRYSREVGTASRHEGTAAGSTRPCSPRSLEADRSLRRRLQPSRRSDRRPHRKIRYCTSKLKSRVFKRTPCEHCEGIRRGRFGSRALWASRRISYSFNRGGPLCIIRRFVAIMSMHFEPVFVFG